MLVLMYHRVAEPADDPYALAVRPAHFEQHVEHLRRRADVVPLTDWFEPSRAARIAVTFDDGYVDNATTAAPVLEQAGLPATWFLTTGTLGGARFWWDVLADVLLQEPRSPGLDLDVAGRRLWLDLGTPAARRGALAVVRRRLKPLPPDVVAHEVERIGRRCGVPVPAEDSRTMSAAQVRELAARAGADVGAHTRSHLMLGGQSAALQRDEVLGSAADVAALTGRPVTAFAYPFGDPAAVGDLAPDLAAEAGCWLACTTAPGLAGRDRDPFHLPRTAVGDWDGAEFAARLAAALSAAG